VRIYRKPYFAVTLPVTGLCLKSYLEACGGAIGPRGFEQNVILRRKQEPMLGTQAPVMHVPARSAQERQRGASSQAPLIVA
jgi:hypothetical protein